MDASRKRSWSVPAVGLGGTAAVLAGLGMLGAFPARASRCDEARVVTREDECTAFVGSAGPCIRAFAEARQRELDEANIAAFARKTRNGSTEVFGLVRDGALGWRKLDGAIADRAYRTCDRAASRAYSSSTRALYRDSGGNTSYSRTSRSGPTSVARGGFGSRASGIRASS